MFQGQLLNTGDVVYSPWMPRGGDNAIFHVEYIDGGATLDIGIVDKNSDTTGNGTEVATFTQLTAAGIGSKPVSGLKELVRFKFTAGGASGTVLLRTLTTVWYDAVAV